MSNENDCIFCGADTSFGSGLFVNRISADMYTDEGEYREGYGCSQCMMLECDRCNKGIAIDDDITPDLLCGEAPSPRNALFADGSHRVHEECLTKEEQIEWQEEQKRYNLDGLVQIGDCS